ncbi:MAG: hypothetical protein R6V56_08200 [Lentisphaeria bacterium]
MLVDKFQKSVKYVSIVTVAGVLASTPAWAEKAEGGKEKAKKANEAVTKAPPQKQPGMEKLRKANKRTQQIRKKLGEIQTKTMKENPGLERQQQALQKLVEKKMEAQGFKSEGAIEELKTIRNKLQGSKDMPAEKREKLMQEFRTKAGKMQQAQQKAMQSEQVQKARQAFEDKLLGAMQEQNKNVKALVEELKETQKQMQAMIQEMSAKRQMQMQKATEKEKSGKKPEKTK